LATNKKPAAAPAAKVPKQSSSSADGGTVVLVDELRDRVKADKFMKMWDQLPEHIQNAYNEASHAHMFDVFVVNHQ
jgi:hypothetical protein